jgi:hypothetical protein
MKERGKVLDIRYWILDIALCFPHSPEKSMGFAGEIMSP